MHCRFPVRFRVVATIVALCTAGIPGTWARTLTAQDAPPSVVLETPLAFDGAGRLFTISPALAARLDLKAPVWPITGAFREARLFRSETGETVLVAQREDGSMARYRLADGAVATLRDVIDTQVLALGRARDRILAGGSGTDVSQPAGNAFVRSQTFLGLAAYGPAAALILSEQSGTAAAGAYFIAAGASFFTSANLVKHRTVSRASALRAGHGGSRGALAGLALSGIVGANSSLERGLPILVGGISGSTLGYMQGRTLTDGEAASAGLFADLSAITALGVAGAFGAFNEREVIVEYGTPGQPGYFTSRRTTNRLEGSGKAAMGAAIGSLVAGYAYGPRYARRASYNVTAGDASVVFTSAALGAAALGAIPPASAGRPATFGAATAGLLLGAVLADRGLVRQLDRSNADGTLVQLGAVAGALVGAGVAAASDAEGRGTLGLAAAGGILGLLAADGIVAPARDAGPLRSASISRQQDNRVSLILGPTSLLRIAF
jgi:hypothetical protein